MTHVHVDLGSYILGGLDPAEQARVESHIAECEECAAAHAELAGLSGLLDLAVMAGGAEQDPLPPAIEERVLDRFARERPAPERARRRWRPRIVLGTGGALVGAAAAAALLIAGFGYHRTAGTYFNVALTPMGTTQVSTKALAGLRSVEGGTRVRLVVQGLPTRPGEVYEVLCSNARWTASAGTFRTDAQGNATVVLTTAAKRGQYDRIRVVRRTIGSPGTVSVLGARLQS